MQISEYLIFNVKVKNVVVFLVMALIFLTGFKADYFNQIALYNRLETVLKLATVFCVFAYVFFYQRKKNFHISLLMSCYYGLMSFLDWLHGEDIQIVYLMTCVAVLVFMEAQLQDDFVLTIRYLSFFLSVYIIINLLTILKYPDGLFSSGITHNPCYLLGHRNSIVKYAIPMITSCSVWAYIKKKNYYPIYVGVVFLINLFSAYKVWSGSALIALVMMLGVTMTAYYIKRMKFKWVYFGALAAFIAISILRLQDKFAFLIEGILHKDLTMTGRTDFWDIGLPYIRQNFWMGTGKVGGEYLGGYLTSFTTLHSFYLDMLFRGGLLLFLAFWGVIFITSRGIASTENYVINNIFLGCMSGYLCVGLVEPITDAVFLLLFVVLLVGYWGAEWSKQNEIQNNS